MKLFYVFIGMMVFMSSMGMAMAAPIVITDCGNLDVIGGYYSLNANITSSSSTHCINITKGGVVLEGNNNFITGKTGAVAASDHGILFMNNVTNVTVRNILVNNTVGGMAAVVINNTNNSFFINVNISSLHDGFSIIQSINNTINKSNISGLNCFSFYQADYGGFGALNSSNNSITNSFIGRGTTQTAILFNGGGLGNNFTNNLINTTTHVTATTPASNNTWNNTVGNYWGKPDLTGFSDTCTDGNADRICDYKYNIYANGFDNRTKNYTSFIPPVSSGFIIHNPVNTTYFTGAIDLNVTNSSTIHSFWYAINSTNYTYYAPYALPNTTLGLPLVGSFNLTVYGNSTDGATIYMVAVFFSVKSFNVVSNYSETMVLETRNSIYNISIIDYSGTSVMISNLYINGTFKGYTSYTHSGNYWNFTYIGPPVNLQDNINQTGYDITWETKINGTMTASTTTNTSTSQTVTRLRILRCAVPMQNSTIFFNITDEDVTTKKIVSDFDMTAYIYVDGGYRNYSFSENGRSDYDFCIFPGWTWANMNATIKYHNDSYEDRWWWTETTNISNNTATVKLYSVNTTSNFITPTFSILNLFQVPQSNVIVKFLRWFVGVNEYRQVATMKTGTEGIGEAPLIPNEQYRYVIESGGNILNIVGPELLSSTTTTKELYTESGSFSEFWKYNGKIGGTCSNVSALITCSFNDFSGLMSSVKLNGNAFNQINNSFIICANTSTASSGFLFCSITGFENKTIFLSLVATLDDGTTVLLWTGILEGTAPLLGLGNYGLFAAFLIIMAMALIGLSRPEIGIAGSVILAYIGVVLSSAFGLMAINQTILVGLGFGTAVVAYIIAREKQ